MRECSLGKFQANGDSRCSSATIWTNRSTANPCNRRGSLRYRTRRAPVSEPILDGSLDANLGSQALPR
jgi:hypothetical protein